MDTSKIIRGIVNGRNYTVTSPIVKEDYGLYLQIEGVELPPTYQVDFSNSENNGTSVTMIGNADGVLIPHQLISTGKDVFAFLYWVGADYGKTVYKFRIPNKLRPDRTDDTPTPEEQSTIDQAINALNTAVEQTAEDVINADASAQSASQSAESAEQSAQTARGWAESAEDYAQSAEQSELQASASATASAQSASQAQGYAQTASEKADSITGLTAQAQTLPSGSSASASYNPQTGVMSFGIPKGKDGTDGNDGYSPTASVSKTGKTTTITITDKNGTTSAQVEDGTDGTDYVLTEQDKQDIADLNMPDILKAFPTDTASGAVASFTDGADGLPLKSLVVNIDPVQDLSNGDPSPENICPISGWTGMNVNANGTLIPISWQTEAGTVYGGSLDVLSGVLTVDMEYGQVTAEYLSSRASGYIGYSASVTALDSKPAIWVRNLFSRAKDRVSGGIQAYCNAFPIRMYDTNISSSQNRCAFVVDGTTINSVETFISAVSALEQNGGGLFVAYELKTPVEIQLTPHEVNSLLGVNNIFADTGDTSAEYRADTKLYINRLTEPDSDMIADSNIVSGQYFMVGNNLYKATANIASGASVIVGTNCIRKSLSEALNEINS